MARTTACGSLSMRWSAGGELFLRVADEDRVPAAEQVLGGLVDWMGNGLLDGWLHLPIPRFEAISDLAEELLQACQTYLARIAAGDARPPRRRTPGVRGGHSDDHGPRAGPRRPGSPTPNP